MDKETKDLIDFYDKRIKDLENKNKEKQDKLDEIEEYIERTISQTKLIEEKKYENIKISHKFVEGIQSYSNYILNIIKGEDK